MFGLDLGPLNSIGGMLQGLPGVAAFTPPSGNAGQLSPAQQMALWQEHIAQLQRAQQAYDAQTKLVSQLQGIANGTGPNVARTDLLAGLNGISGNAAAMASGARGNGGVLARYGAMQAANDAAAKLQQQQALAGVQERETALGNIGGVLGNQANEEANLYGTSLGSTVGLANVARQQQQAEQQRQDRAVSSIIGGFSQGLGGISSGGGGIGSSLGK